AERLADPLGDHFGVMDRCEHGTEQDDEQHGCEQPSADGGRKRIAAHGGSSKQHHAQRRIDPRRPRHRTLCAHEDFPACCIPLAEPGMAYPREAPMNRRATVDAPKLSRSLCPPFGKRTNCFGSFASANSRSPKTMGIAGSLSPCMTSNGTLTCAIRRSERNGSLIRSRAGRIGKADAATSAIELYGAS